MPWRTSYDTTSDNAARLVRALTTLHRFTFDVTGQLGTQPALVIVASKRKADDSGYEEHLFTSFDASDVPIWAALRCSSAANFYFRPRQVGDAYFRDGGLVANNPTELTLRFLLGRYAADPRRVKALVSIGTGTVPQTTTPSVTAPTARSHTRASFLSTASEASADWSKKVSEASAGATAAISSLPYPGLDVDASHLRTVDIISSQPAAIIAPSHYLRIQPSLVSDVRLDDTSRASLDQLIQSGTACARDFEDDLEDLALSSE
mmetsp:Transcript_1235/g.3542  ORF Transcript_1235/g.3542 Transcript_1235/m.3542 type:complete len:263 (+) Transcript_1235:235-1023(+)